MDITKRGVAKSLAISTRTRQRRLGQEDKNFGVLWMKSVVDMLNICSKVPALPI